MDQEKVRQAQNSSKPGDVSFLNSPFNENPGELVELNTWKPSVSLYLTIVDPTYYFFYLFRHLVIQILGIFLNLSDEVLEVVS